MPQRVIDLLESIEIEEAERPIRQPCQGIVKRLPGKLLLGAHPVDGLSEIYSNDPLSCCPGVSVTISLRADRRLPRSHGTDDIIEVEVRGVGRIGGGAKVDLDRLARVRAQDRAAQAHRLAHPASRVALAYGGPAEHGD